MRTTTSALLLTVALTLAGCASGDAGAGADAEGGDAAGADVGGSSLTFIGTDDLAWEQPGKSVGAGTVEVTLECGDAVGHALAIEGVQGGADLAACGAGGSDSGSVELDAGELTYFCTVPGHRDAGMEGTLSVG